MPQPDARRAGPGQETGSQKTATTTPLNSVPPSADRLAYRRRRWAFRLIGRCAVPPPRYGSAEWEALPEADPAKVAAVVIAAECWARSGDTLAEDLAAELETMRKAHKQLEDAEYVARRDAHRRSWRGGRFNPTEAEIAADMAEREAEWFEWTRGEAS